MRSMVEGHLPSSVPPDGLFPSVSRDAVATSSNRGGF